MLNVAQNNHNHIDYSGGTQNNADDDDGDCDGDGDVNDRDDDDGDNENAGEDAGLSRLANNLHNNLDRQPIFVQISVLGKF